MNGGYAGFSAFIAARMAFTIGFMWKLSSGITATTPPAASTAWPTSGDLGLSIIWTHPHADKNITRLMWSENGHPWTPRWFGVVRLEPQGVLPFLLRIP